MSKRKHGNKIKNFFTFHSLLLPTHQVVWGFALPSFFSRLFSFLVSFSRFAWRECDEKLYTSEAETRALMQLSTWAMAAWICLMCCNFPEFEARKQSEYRQKNIRIFLRKTFSMRMRTHSRMAEVEGRNEATLKFSCIFVHARLHTLCCCWFWQPAHGMRIERQKRRNICGAK